MKAASKVFRALADPTRRQILEELKGGELAAGDIASRFSISGPSISRHLAILDAIEAQDFMQAANLMRAHLNGARRGKLLDPSVFSEAA